MNRYFGYCRISTPKQSIDRQVRNILAAYPQAEIIKEVYTGRKFQGRKEFDRLMRKITPGDTIIFDSVSRMSRDAVFPKFIISFVVREHTPDTLSIKVCPIFVIC